MKAWEKQATQIPQSKTSCCNSNNDFTMTSSHLQMMLCIHLSSSAKSHYHINDLLFKSTDYKQGKISFKHNQSSQLFSQNKVDNMYERQGLVLKEAQVGFKKVISDNPIESLHMVDFIQRLGIEHLFEEQIEAALQKQHLILRSDLNNFVNSQQLYDVALSFRLLRQGGHYLNPDVLFDSFKINKRKFREQYGEDVRGLTALFEATQLSIEGEDILDEANYICLQLLQEWITRHQDHHQAIHVANTLQQPLRHRLPRFMDRSTVLLSYFKDNDNNGWACIQELAEINNCIVQLTNQNEILQIYKWWKDHRMAEEAKFAGYQPLKWYLWQMACITDPHFSDQRIELTKSISLVYVIDDIFDVHGTLEQLTIFTDAVSSWEMSGTEQLPYYMRICLRALYDITNDFAEMIDKRLGLNPIDTLKKSWVQLLNAFLEEVHWLNSGQLPKSEKYLKNGIVSTGAHVMLVHAFFLFGLDGTKETIAILNDFSNIISSVGKIVRLSDDLEGVKSKGQNGIDGSYLDCYMSEHQDVSVEDAQKYVAELISIEWKCLNQEMLMVPKNPFSSSFTKICLNAARMVPLMYHYRSNNASLQNLNEHVKSLIG